jgi:hypothetical protein
MNHARRGKSAKLVFAASTRMSVVTPWTRTVMLANSASRMAASATITGQAPYPPAAFPGGDTSRGPSWHGRGEGRLSCGCLSITLGPLDAATTPEERARGRGMLPAMGDAPWAPALRGI